jgi:uncharacterized membrane protein YfcA
MAMTDNQIKEAIFFGIVGAIGSFLGNKLLNHYRGRKENELVF